jgi:molybdopterin synthase catalytic subunit
MAGQVRLAQLRAEALSVDEVLAAVAGPGVGGTAIFVGTVRDQDGGRAVTDLEYTAHPSALARLEEVAARAAATDDDVVVAAVHRVGPLTVGDLAVVVAAAAPHRDRAFEVGRRLIDELKHEVPIWKHQTFADGSQEWVAAGG